MSAFTSPPCKNCQSPHPESPTELGYECAHCLAIYPTQPYSTPLGRISDTLSSKREEGELLLVHEWKRPGAKAAVAFTLVWMAMLGIFLRLGWTAISERLESLLPTWALSLPLMGITACFGWALFALYSALAGWFNTTFISIRMSSMQIWSRPLPVRGRLHLPFGLRDTFVRKVIVPMKKGEFNQFQVEGIFENGKTFAFIKELDSEEEAFAVEAVVRRFVTEPQENPPH